MSDRAEKAQVRQALDFLVELARGNDYADDRQVIEAQWTLEEALGAREVERDQIGALALRCAADSLDSPLHVRWTVHEVQRWLYGLADELAPDVVTSPAPEGGQS